jgi:hypothetical protein
MPTALFNNNDRVHKFNFNEEYGFSNFATRQDLEQHLMEDTFIIRCNLEVQKVLKVEATVPTILPPSSLQDNLSNLLESGKGADVFFQVDDTKIGAHRYILETRYFICKFSCNYFLLFA